jgi:signal transduction histidine kinase
VNQKVDEGGPDAEAALREQLALVLLGGFVHDVGSPLAALTSNLSVAKELADAEDDASRAELREVLDDLEMATARLTELASDLRGYVGLPVGRGTFEELTRCALRLARSHLSRRVQVELAIDPELRPRLPAAEVLRAVGALVVATTRDLPSGAKGHVLTVRTEPEAFALEIAPPPPVDFTASIGVATARLAREAVVSKDASRWTIRVPLRWV